MKQLHLDQAQVLEILNSGPACPIRNLLYCDHQLHHIYLHLEVESRDLCPSDLDGDTKQADHQGVRNWVFRVKMI